MQHHMITTLDSMLFTLHRFPNMHLTSFPSVGRAYMLDFYGSTDSTQKGLQMRMADPPWNSLDRHGGGLALCAHRYAAPVPGRWRVNLWVWPVPNHPHPGVPLPATVPPKNQLFFDSVSDPTFWRKMVPNGNPRGSQNPQKSVKIWKSAPQSALWDGTWSRPWKNIEN